MIKVRSHTIYDMHDERDVRRVEFKQMVAALETAGLDGAFRVGRMIVAGMRLSWNATADTDMLELAENLAVELCALPDMRVNEEVITGMLYSRLAAARRSRIASLVV